LKIVDQIRDQIFDSLFRRMSMYTKRLWSITCLFLAMALLISPLGVTGKVLAAPDTDRPVVGTGPEVVVSEASLSQPLSSIKPSLESPQDLNNPMLMRAPIGMPKTLNAVGGSSFDPSVVQTINGGGGGMPAPTANFEGIGALGSLPPDTNGDIGYDPVTRKKYYMQWVNTRLQIWEVTNPLAPVSLYGPANGNTALFSGMGGLCETTNAGDPIVLYDHLANRWFASQFAYAAGNFRQCLESI